ncbi:MAG: hypothetical protein JXA43_03365 [Candidatus Diapherotrites archaeon]|nr:hypothetical protein [Candidatus Diapherotrites archaeon]
MSNDIIVYEKRNSVAVNPIKNEIILQEFPAELSNFAISKEFGGMPSNAHFEIQEQIKHKPFLFEGASSLPEPLKTDLQKLNIGKDVEKALEELALEIPKENSYFALLKYLTESNFKARNIMMKATKETIYKCSLCEKEVEEFEKECPFCMAKFEDLIDWNDYDCL